MSRLRRWSCCRIRCGYRREVPDRSGRSQVQFLHLGRLGERKGGYDLVNAFAALPESLRSRARLVLAGDGDVEGMRKLAAPFGDRVRVLSWIDAHERDRLLRAERCVRVAVARRGCADGAARGDGDGTARRSPRPVGGIPDVFRARRRRNAGDARRRGADSRGDDELHRATRRRASLPAGGACERARPFDVHIYARRLADIYQRIAPVGGNPGIWHERRHVLCRLHEKACPRARVRPAQSVLLRPSRRPYSSAAKRGSSSGGARGRTTAARRRCSWRSGTEYGAVGARRRHSRAGRCSTRSVCVTGFHAFTTGCDWFSASANTGGTTGVPLKLAAIARRHRVRTGVHRSRHPGRWRRGAHRAHRGAARRQSARYRGLAESGMRGDQRRPAS